MNVANLAAHLGTLDYPTKVGLPLSYFQIRGIFLDARGPLEISATSVWGFEVRVYTESHDVDQGPGQTGATVPYGVVVEDGAWIGSHSVLAGCRIGAGAIVAAGSVVRGQTVAPGVMVAGNPARVVARWDGQRWVYLDAAECGYARVLA
jgi:acetyltransferase-like isoleucine patch superfamily enzyme